MAGAGHPARDDLCRRGEAGRDILRRRAEPIADPGQAGVQRAVGTVMTEKIVRGHDRGLFAGRRLQSRLGHHRRQADGRAVSVDQGHDTVGHGIADGRRPSAAVPSLAVSSLAGHDLATRGLAIRGLWPCPAWPSATGATQAANAPTHSNIANRADNDAIVSNPPCPCASIMMRRTQTRRPTATFEELSDAARAASLRATLAQRPNADDIWVFAYGALMWRPCFDHVERCQATLAGYQRRFSAWTLIARGTPAAPGLALALEDSTERDGGGHCHGVAYRLAPATAAAGLAALWAREMLTSIYHPRWLSVTLDARPAAARPLAAHPLGAQTVAAISFVVDKTDAQYAGTLPGAEQAALIAAAHGQFGSCRDYLANTVAELAALGIDEPDLTALLRDVDAITAQGNKRNAPKP